MLLTIILLALSVSIDSFGIGITYGLRKTSLSTPAKFILFFVSLLFVGISVAFGYFLISILPANIIKIISVILLVFMGFLIIYEAMNTNEKKEYKSHKIFLKSLGITIQIIRNPISSDLNNSKNVTSGFFRTISLKATEIATDTSIIAPNPDNNISA